MRFVRRVSRASNQPVALFGGTFDPVHYARQRTALEVRDLLEVDDFRFLPAGTPPHRTNQVGHACHRLAMLSLAIAGVDGFSIDEQEINREGPSFMVDTLANLRAGLESAPIILVMGQDSANTLESWHHWRQVFSLAHLVIMSRPGDREDYPAELEAEISGRRADTCKQLFKAPAGMVRKVDVTGFSISSRNIRAKLMRGESPRFMLPDAVLDYLRNQSLYS